MYVQFVASTWPSVPMATGRVRQLHSCVVVGDIDGDMVGEIDGDMVGSEASMIK